MPETWVATVLARDLVRERERVRALVDEVTCLCGELAMLDLEHGEEQKEWARTLDALEHRLEAVESRLLASAVVRADAVDRLRALAPDAVPVWYDLA